MIHSTLFDSTRESFRSAGGKGYQKDISLHSSKEVTVDDFEISKVIGRGSFGKVYMVTKKN